MAVIKTNKEGFILDEDGKPKVNSINTITGKKVMPKSTGRPRGIAKVKTVPGAEKVGILKGRRGEQVRQVLENTHAMGNEEIIARGRELAATSLETTTPAMGAIMGMNRDELAAMCYRLATRGLTINQIAAQMKMTPKEVGDLTKRLSTALQLDPKTLNVGYYMGESLAFYAEIRQLALFAASANGNSASLKLRALEVAMNAEAQKNAFLTKIGVYSPTVIERVESWIVSTTESMAAPPDDATRVNLAAEIGRALAKRAQSIADVNLPADTVEDVQARSPNA